METYLVGGWVRDHLMGIPSKDVDFVAIAPSFDAMEQSLVDQGFEIFLSKSEFSTTRARGPKDFEFAGHRFGNMTFDFVLAREDGPSTDGRRPDWVKPADLLTDLSRRDFKMNAIAMDKDGNIIDPFGGQFAIEGRWISAVGDPKVRFAEDGLRILRALRFSVTKDFFLTRATRDAFDAELLAGVSADRMRGELEKMFKADPIKSVLLLAEFPAILNAVVTAGVWFAPTLKEK